MKKLDDEALARIAEVVHEAIRAWQRANGQKPAPSWSRAPQWMRRDTTTAVTRRLSNPGAPASAQHDDWMEMKSRDGWRFGKAKSGVRKTHPLMVPYSDLPEVERRKDALVAAVIDSLTGKMR